MNAPMKRRLPTVLITLALTSATGGVHTADALSVERRELFRNAAAVVAGIGTTNVLSRGLTIGGAANAACLPGDISKDCIGVYKLPYVDATESEWLYDKNTLELFAPDVRYIEVKKQPETIALAKKQLRSERVKIKFIRQVVLDGELEQAGLLILNLIPMVTSAGLKLQTYVEVKTVETESQNSNAEKELRKFQQAFEVLVAEWNSIDIELGFALRGQRGVTAVAQIEILQYLKDATVALDDFIKLAELNTKGVINNDNDNDNNITTKTTTATETATTEVQVAS